MHLTSLDRMPRLEIRDWTVIAKDVRIHCTLLQLQLHVFDLRAWCHFEVMSFTASRWQAWVHPWVVWRAIWATDLVNIIC